MNDRAQTRPRPSWASSEGAPLQKAIPQSSTVEDYEESASQSPSESAAHYPTPPSSASKMEYPPSNVQHTVTGSAVTQLTSTEDTAASKPTGNRNKMLREARNFKIKGAHRAGSMSSSGPGPEPNSVPHEAFSSSPELSYFKSPPSGRQIPASAYTSSAVAVANYPQSPISPMSYAGWGPNHTPAGYPPQDPFSSQQSGLQPIDQPYHSGFTYVNQKANALEPVFSNQPSSYDFPYTETQEDMAAPNDDLPIDALDGYASVAARVSGQAEPRLKPLYRRFDWLHHRTLLYHQDQLGALEEELIRLDSITTRNGGRMAVSGREERVSAHDIHRSRHRVMERIETSLRRYRNVVMSLEDMQKLPAPTGDEIQAYRTFLNQRQILIEAETQFLGQPDLIALSQGPATNAPANNQAPPPPPLVPLRTLINGFSMSFLCLAVLMMALPDLITRLVMVVCYGVLVTTVLSTTGHLRRLRQLFEG
ncbi:hypothetical protein F53441_6971 [Fusarium austroafricanum]|uniref:DUF6594 domain-containing protein n=1 Tax=Fusarium austroafricanum TaxID=2364996 RepID=A0A8H4NYW8_9HYPO|nr:hypothetical protein F53441_6971 [Fusarium austroafricanum]